MPNVAESALFDALPESPRLPRPPKELKAFDKVHLAPGESTVVDLVLDDRSFAYWDPGQADWAHVISYFDNDLGIGPGIQDRRAPGWQVDPGRYDVLVGRSSVDLVGSASVTIEAPAPADEDPAG